MDTFCSSGEAESALCRDRPNFLTRHDIVQFIPPAIAKRVNHPGDIAQIEGFQELFVHLNTDPSAEKLRKLVVDYFNGSPILRPYLSQSQSLHVSYNTICLPLCHVWYHFGRTPWRGDTAISQRTCRCVDIFEPPTWIFGRKFGVLSIFLVCESFIDAE